jgi:hypothetical protein
MAVKLLVPWPPGLDAHSSTPLHWDSSKRAAHLLLRLLFKLDGLKQLEEAP